MNVDDISTQITIHIADLLFNSLIPAILSEEEMSKKEVLVDTQRMTITIGGII